MFYSSLLPVSHFYIPPASLSWHPNAGSEQVAAALMKTKQPMEQVDGRVKPGAAAANLFLLNHAAGGEFICSLPHRDPSPWPLSWSSCVSITAAKWLKSTLMGNVFRSYWENCLFLLYTMIYCLTVNCCMSCHPLQSVLKTLVWWMSITHVLKPKDTEYKGLQFSLTSVFICDQDEWCVLL